MSAPAIERAAVEPRGVPSLSEPTVVFDVFFERWARAISPTLGPPLLALGPATLYVLAQLGSAEWQAADDRAASLSAFGRHGAYTLLGAISVAASFALFYACRWVRWLIIRIESRVQHLSDAERAEIRAAFSDLRLASFGGVFALLNAGVAGSLGPPDCSGLQLAVFYGGVLLAGFLCGIAVGGLVGVTTLVRVFAAHCNDPNVLDYTAPDGAAGTHFISSAIHRFLSVTMIVAFLISVYVRYVEWRHASHSDWVMGVQIFWALFPWIVVAVALVVPALTLNRELLDYKFRMEEEAQRELATIGSGDDERRKSLAERRRQLHGMKTWPFWMQHSLLGYFATNIAGQGLVTSDTLWETIRWLSKGG